MDCKPIKRLRLKAAYEDHKKFQAIECDADYLAELFEWTDRGAVFIYDDADEGHSRFVSDTKGLGVDKIIRIDNRNHRDLFLWHIDGVLYKKDSKCDCAFITDNRMGFIEFKSNAVNHTELSTKENYDKAKSQLKLTLDDVATRCRNVGIELTRTIAVEAYAVFNRTVPAHNAYQKKLAAQFLLETNGVPLLFKNSTKI